MAGRGRGGFRGRGRGGPGFPLAKDDEGNVLSTQIEGPPPLYPVSLTCCICEPAGRQRLTLIWAILAAQRSSSQLSVVLQELVELPDRPAITSRDERLLVSDSDTAACCTGPQAIDA